MLFIDMYIMKNFKNIRNLINEFVERGNNWGSGGDDGNPDQHMRQLMREMRKHPFKHTTSDRHEIQWNDSAEAMRHIAHHLAKHDNAYGENAVHHGEDSPEAMYHSDAGDKHSAIYESLRNHIQNHPKIHPTLRSYAKPLFDVTSDVSDLLWAESNPNWMVSWSKGLRDNNHHHLHDIHQDFKNTPDMGYFLHKDEME